MKFRSKQLKDIRIDVEIAVEPPFRQYLHVAVLSQAQRCTLHATQTQNHLMNEQKGCVCFAPSLMKKKCKIVSHEVNNGETFGFVQHDVVEQFEGKKSA